MKNTITLGILLFGLTVHIGCKKDPANVPSITSTPTPVPRSPQNTAPLNTAPHANAGLDHLVFLPINKTEFYGSCWDLDNNITEYNWEKISGPNSFSIETKNALGTKVSDLEKGIYQFELTITDKSGLYDKDTVMAIVGELPANPKEIIFKDRAWSCDWYCGIEIKNLYAQIPPGSLFKIFIQRDTVSGWNEVVEDSGGNTANTYTYIFYNGDLLIWVYGDSGNDTPDIKIVY